MAAGRYTLDVAKTCSSATFKGSKLFKNTDLLYSKQTFWPACVHASSNLSCIFVMAVKIP